MAHNATLVEKAPPDASWSVSPFPKHEETSPQVLNWSEDEEKALVRK